MIPLKTEEENPWKSLDLEIEDHDLLKIAEECHNFTYEGLTE